MCHFNYYYSPAEHPFLDHAISAFLFSLQWSISQHPNFLGNLVLWAGILFMNATSLVESSASTSVIDRVLRFKRLGFALLSPLFMWILFYGQSIGLITNSVALAKEKYGEDPNYKKYVESVPLIIPRLFPSWK